MNTLRFSVFHRARCLVPLTCMAAMTLLPSSCASTSKTPVQRDSDQNAKPAPTITIHPASREPVAGYTPAEDPLSGTVYIAPEVIVTNADIRSAELQTKDGGYGVLITLSAEGGKKMEAFTSAHLGETVAILIDGSLQSSATVRDVITDKILIASAQSEAERLAAKLNP